MRREAREVTKTRRRYILRIGRKILRHRGVFMRMCILQSKKGTNVESTIAEADKNAEKPTQYNRIQHKTLMISVTT